jgi:hypothetical protein
MRVLIHSWFMPAPRPKRQAQICQASHPKAQAVVVGLAYKFVRILTVQCRNFLQYNVDTSYKSARFFAHKTEKTCVRLPEWRLLHSYLSENGAQFVKVHRFG